MRMMVAIALLLLGGLVLATCSLFNVPSGPGLPVGPSLRTSTHIVTLVSTNEPHPPALQPNEVQVIPRKVGLLLTPLDGSQSPPMIELARRVQPDSNPNGIRLLGIIGDTLWIRAGKVYAFDLKARGLDEDARPPSFGPDPKFADWVATGHRVTQEHWLGVHLPEDVESGKLKPGSAVMPDLFQLRSVPFEPRHEGQIVKPERRRLYRGHIDVSGPIPMFASIEPVGAEEYGNGVVLLEAPSAPLKVSDPDSILVAYESRYPENTLHVMRVDLEGKVLWTANTRIRRDPQIMPGHDVMAFRGEPLVPSGTFPQPILVLLDTHTGRMTTTVLRW